MRKKLGAHFSMLTGSFKQTGVERGHQAEVSHSPTFRAKKITSKSQKL
jgi:hypothetical protein